MYRCVVFDYILTIYFVIHTCSFAHANSNVELLAVPHHQQIPDFSSSSVLFSGLRFDFTHWTDIPFVSPLRCCINGWIRDGTRSESQRFHNLTFRLSNAGNWTRVYEYVAWTTAAKFNFWALLIATRNLEPVRWSSGIGTDWPFTSQVTKIPHTICLAPVHMCNQSSYIMKIDCKWKCPYRMMGEHDPCQLPFYVWSKSNKKQQLRLFFAMALLYIFRVTISPIIRSTMLYMAFQVGRYTVS